MHDRKDGSTNDRKSTSGYVFLLGNKAISWASKKQMTIALSSAEAEYMAATSVACEATWLRKILQDVQQDSKTPTVIHCDNMSANCSSILQNSIFISPCSTSSLMKWYLISMCFVQLWNTRFLVIAIADILSQ